MLSMSTQMWALCCIAKPICEHTHACQHPATEGMCARRPHTGKARER